LIVPLQERVLLTGLLAAHAGIVIAVVSLSTRGLPEGIDFTAKAESGDAFAAFWGVSRANRPMMSEMGIFQQPNLKCLFLRFFPMAMALGDVGP
jgi:hypothetical protein